MNDLISAKRVRMTAPLSKAQLQRAYRQMKTIREFEERLHVEIATGEIPGFTHLYAGQEAVTNYASSGRIYRAGVRFNF